MHDLNGHLGVCAHACMHTNVDAVAYMLAHARTYIHASWCKYETPGTSGAASRCSGGCKGGCRHHTHQLSRRMEEENQRPGTCSVRAVCAFEHRPYPLAVSAACARVCVWVGVYTLNTDTFTRSRERTRTHAHVFNTRVRGIQKKPSMPVRQCVCVCG